MYFRLVELHTLNANIYSIAEIYGVESQFIKGIKQYFLSIHIYPNPKSKTNSQAVINRRKAIKSLLITYKGGKCEDCGLVEKSAVYDFHHNDPNKKEFGLAHRGHCKSWEIVKKEVDKCNLLCSNCHRLVHAEEHEENWRNGQRN